MKVQLYNNYTSSKIPALPGAENRRPNADHEAFGTKGSRRRLIRHWREMAES
jgi:hypothetical protein